jgi:Cu+-exporting ATPase
MFRRNFLQRIAFGASVGLASKRSIVTYRIKGFYCVTCAVGLDTLLQQKKGVLRSKSSYPAATTVIEFDPGVVTGKEIRAFIAEMGFTADEQPKL